MHIVRSDEDGETSVVTLAAMREELMARSIVYDPEVNAIENVTVLLFHFEGAEDTDEFSIVLPGRTDVPDRAELTFTVREAPVEVTP